MTLPESETVDHHRHIHTTLQLRSQHKTPHKSNENQAMDKEAWSELSPPYAVTTISFNIFGEGL